MGFDMDGYVDVAERIRLFREKYPEGSLQPANLEKPFTVATVGEKIFVTYVAAAYRTPDDPRPGIGVAWEPFPGPTQFTKDSELMNAETSAWGRAIVAALAADTSKVASAQEVRNRSSDRPAQSRGSSGPKWRNDPASEAQVKTINRLVNQTGMVVTPWPLPDNLTKGQANDMLDMLKAEPTKDETVVRRGADPDAVAALQEQLGATPV